MVITVFYRHLPLVTASLVLRQKEIPCHCKSGTGLLLIIPYYFYFKGPYSKERVYIISIIGTLLKLINQSVQCL
ncbi:MAG: hypothetical protein A4E55_02003 [Pelotomaculum sp. PtaU1.Bin035]|nr:MAG: hypothetical protein A4E55_02003 [Pelotomaculum sp. PtaU1.Bin035]